MIRISGLTKTYRTQAGIHTVFENLNCEIPPSTGLALLGRNGAGKSTLINILGGAEFADRGEIVTNARISWPVGLAGGFQPSLNARDNVKFVARLYAGKNEVPLIVERVREFADIGEYFDMPTRTYSSGMRSRVAFGLSMAFDFDYYLIDEVTSVGDPQFRKKCSVALKEKKAKGAGFIVVSHQMDTIREFCSSALVFGADGARYFDNLEEAIKAYQGNG